MIDLLMIAFVLAFAAACAFLVVLVSFAILAEIPPDSLWSGIKGPVLGEERPWDDWYGAVLFLVPLIVGGIAFFLLVAYMLRGTRKR